MATLQFHLLLSLTFTLCLSLLLPIHAKTHWKDTEVLKQFKYSIDQTSITPGSCLSSWDFSYDPCDSLFSDHFTCGFRCDAAVSGLNRVTELALDQAGYYSSASLDSVSWESLPYLQSVDLSNNYFSGPVPGSLTNLTRLTRLGLSRNSFSGEIPSFLPISLQELYLDNNNLQGGIPASLNGLVGLKRLELQSNNLSGEFPELGSLKNLYFLDASDNVGISGNFPAVLPSNLVQISMRNNSLQGKLPSKSFQLVPYLQVLDLSHNRLSDSVPLTLFSSPSLQQLTLSHNSFSSIETPATLTALIQSELIAVDLSDNDLRGFLPSFMALMPKLSALSLENNKFTGVIPTQYAVKAVLPYAGVSPFARLLLGGNYLFGPIPGPSVM
ncbi:Probable inactive leucine-rich repeat receptor kinase XIAO [Linum grandiflorum]